MIRRLRRKFVLLCNGASSSRSWRRSWPLMNGFFIVRADATLDGMLAFLIDNGGDFPAVDRRRGARMPRGSWQPDWGGVTLIPRKRRLSPAISPCC